MRSNFESFQKTSKVINDYLELLIYSLCSRCAKNNNTPVSVSNLLWNVHHRGSINDLLAGVKYRDINGWTSDLKHGLMHGMSTSIVAGILMRGEFGLLNKSLSDVNNPKYFSDKCNSKISIDLLHASCLLHDFLRTKGHKIKNHDSDLESYFPSLLPQVYSHLRPKEYNHPFLIADVIELRRYKDYKKWYKSGRIESLLDPDEVDYFDCYYSNIRPSLEKCFIHRGETWARHGAEIKQDLSLDKYPQNTYYPFPFEIDRLPFSYCFHHGVFSDRINAWGIFRGIIPLSEFRKKKCKIVFEHPQKHDVLHADFKTGFDDWVFVINYEKDNPIYQMDWVLDMIDEMIGNGFKVVEQKTLNNFIHIVNATTDRMLFLSE